LGARSINIWNHAHPRRVLRDYETHHNQHRPPRRTIPLLVSGIVALTLAAALPAIVRTTWATR